MSNLEIPGGTLSVSGMPEMSEAAQRLYYWNFERGFGEEQRPTINEYVNSREEKGRRTAIFDESVEKARSVVAANQLIFYIAGGLTGMSEEVKARYGMVSDAFANYRHDELRTFAYAPHLHGTDPVVHPNVSPKEVRDIDQLWSTIVPHAQINFLKPAALGNGVEAGWAEIYGVPTLHLVDKEHDKDFDERRVSRLLRGMEGILGHIIYDDFAAEAIPQLQQFKDQLIEHNERGTVQPASLDGSY